MYLLTWLAFPFSANYFPSNCFYPSIVRPMIENRHNIPFPTYIIKIEIEETGIADKKTSKLKKFLLPVTGIILQSDLLTERKHLWKIVIWLFLWRRNSIYSGVHQSTDFYPQYRKTVLKLQLLFLIFIKVHFFLKIHQYIVQTFLCIKVLLKSTTISLGCKKAHIFQIWYCASSNNCNNCFKRIIVFISCSFWLSGLVSFAMVWRSTTWTIGDFNKHILTRWIRTFPIEKSLSTLLNSLLIIEYLVIYWKFVSHFFTLEIYLLISKGGRITKHFLLNIFLKSWWKSTNKIATSQSLTSVALWRNLFLHLPRFPRMRRSAFRSVFPSSLHLLQASKYTFSLHLHLGQATSAKQKSEKQLMERIFSMRWILLGSTSMSNHFVCT